MPPKKVTRRLVPALLVIAAAAYVSPLVSARAAENRVAESIAATLRQQGFEPVVYVWPSISPDTAAILERNGVATRQCPGIGDRTCVPAVHIHRSVSHGLFEFRVRWQYNRDHHGNGGTRRFFGLLGWLRELEPERTYIQ